MIGTFFVYHPPSHPRPDGLTKWQEFKQLDFIGAFLFIAGLAVFLFGLESGGNMYPWTSAGALAPLIIGLIVFLGSFIYDFIVPKDPLFPWYLFKNFREFSALPVLVFVAGKYRGLLKYSHFFNANLGRDGVLRCFRPQCSNDPLSSYQQPDQNRPSLASIWVSITPFDDKMTIRLTSTVSPNLLGA